MSFLAKMVAIIPEEHGITIEKAGYGVACYFLVNLVSLLAYWAWASTI